MPMRFSKGITCPSASRYRDLPEAGQATLPAATWRWRIPRNQPRAEYDLTVLSADGRMILLHRATASGIKSSLCSRHPARSWETTSPASIEII